ncbi:hypothetical protein L2E82_15431 [Cichorium intybus]|uniref:Uncharacterized protein n=1 Tax=Cichorium intybus TaxID=13427 RepID=A0ACB9F248_CICIN|nr:hypothetical protein L2E82_15431 [Cichorium intybus]
MAAEAQQFFDLFDSYWFAHQIFNKPHILNTRLNKDEEPIAKLTQTLVFPAVPTVNVRSYSAQLLMDTNNQSFISDSPSSVLNLETPRLQTIYSGMEVKEIQELPVKEKDRVSRRRRKRKSRSKSLSELEFEELKGFMDLGFVFSEKDKDSSLVSIIPGLQRLGEDEKEEVDGYVVASRPYLSEAWDDLENKREEESLRLVRIPALGNEMEIKNQLRFWAHSVASVVR